MSRKPRWTATVTDSEGCRFVFTGTDRNVVEARAATKRLQLIHAAEARASRERLRESREQERTERQNTRAQREQEKEDRKRYLEEQRRAAASQTRDAEAALDSLRSILKDGLSVKPTLSFESLKKDAPFPESPPVPPPDPVLGSRPPEPRFTAPVQPPSAPNPLTKLLEAVLPSRKLKRLETEASLEEARRQDAEAAFRKETEAWRTRCEANEKANEALKAEHRSRLEAHARQHTEYSARLQSFRERQEEENRKIDAFQTRYEASEPDAVEEYFQAVLGRSIYPQPISPSSSVRFSPDAKMLVVECDLPSKEELPTLKSVKYVQAEDDFIEAEMSERDLNQLYDSVIYQVTIRTLDEVFRSDYANTVDAAVFNGYVPHIDRSTGNSVRPCIVTVQAGRKEFAPFDLSAVDPKACFRRLKGVGASQLSELAPVAPLVMFDTNDSRFVEGHSVAVSSDTNLAAMDWEEFEHLVRELFEREFSKSGAEVKITQASRDGGVDAVIFDPDPIRGGKFIVQAKRYTNVVGVSAVRDLFGTMLNEGAAKGFLVTTSAFGPDAYQFAKDKPIALIDGSRLLWMLERQGIAASINIAAARESRIE